MATIGALIRGDLPPAGNPIAWRLTAGGLPSFPGYHGIGVQSGTAALALALLAARALRPDIVSPEVILPGYGCPDLVSAADYAGLRVRLVDIGADDPGYRLDALEAAIGADTVAVVAVNFLGIRERFELLRPLLTERGITLVEDDAQWFPEPLAAPQLQGEMVSLSFGRGKPVSLLGGGALYLRDEVFERLASGWIGSQCRESEPESTLVLRGKYALYNLLRQPALYGLLSRNPLFPLGLIRYKSLADITALDDLREKLLAANVVHQMSGDRGNERIAAGVVSVHSRVLVDIPTVLGDRCGRLLRYPVLCRNANDRDRLWRALQSVGAGATAMYQRHLPQIEGVAGRFDDVELPGAEQFARRLLTLPIHVGAGNQHWQRINDVLSGFESL